MFRFLVKARELAISSTKHTDWLSHPHAFQRSDGRAASIFMMNVAVITLGNGSPHPRRQNPLLNPVRQSKVPKATSQKHNTSYIRPTGKPVSVPSNTYVHSYCIQGNEIPLPAQWNLIGRSMTAPSPVSSPSGILLPPSSNCAFDPARRKRHDFQKCYVNIFIIFFNLCNSEIAWLKIAKVEKWLYLPRFGFPWLQKRHERKSCTVAKVTNLHITSQHCH